MTFSGYMQEKNNLNDFFSNLEEYLSSIPEFKNCSIHLASPLYANYYYHFLINNLDHFRFSIPLVEKFELNDVINAMMMEESDKELFLKIRFLIFKNFNKNEAKIIGDISLYNIENLNFQEAYIGYKLDKNYEGNGIISNYFKLIIDFAFSTLNIHRLVADVLPENSKSVNILNKHNFLCEGISRKNLQIANKWRDHLRFSLITDNN